MFEYNSMFCDFCLLHFISYNSFQNLEFSLECVRILIRAYADNKQLEFLF